jgi:hypothetical protein
MKHYLQIMEHFSQKVIQQPKSKSVGKGTIGSAFTTLRATRKLHKPG